MNENPRNSWRQWTRMEISKGFHFCSQRAQLPFCEFHFTCFRFHYQNQQINSHTCLQEIHSILICQQIAIRHRSMRIIFPPPRQSRDLLNRKWVLCTKAELNSSEWNFSLQAFLPSQKLRSQSLHERWLLVEFNLCQNKPASCQGRKRDVVEWTAGEKIEVKFAFNVKFNNSITREIMLHHAVVFIVQ